jgi:hypothetical protein
MVAGGAATSGGAPAMGEKAAMGAAKPGGAPVVGKTVVGGHSKGGTVGERKGREELDGE